MKKRSGLNGHTILLLITIALFIVLYAGGCIAYGSKGFTHLQTFLNILITNAGLICVACGIALYILGGGSWTRIGVIAGIGTVITAFFMGPLIDFFRVKVTDPMVEPAGL